MTDPHHHAPRRGLTVANWIALVGLVVGQTTALIATGGAMYLQINTRVTVVETRLSVLSDERQKVTDGINRRLDDLKQDIRDLSAKLDSKMP